MQLKPLSWYKRLADSKWRRREGVFLVEGTRVIEQIFSNAPGAVAEILTTETSDLKIDTGSVSIRKVDLQQIKKISTSQTPRDAVAVVRIPQDTPTSLPPENPGARILLLEDIQDPGNVGTLIRTAAALGYKGIILSSKSADPFSPKSLQSTAGAILYPWIRRSSHYLETVKALKNVGYSVVSADIRGEKTVDFSVLPKHILALGSEGSGLTEELLALSDYIFQIPMEENAVESLNVAACGAISMFMGTRGQKFG
ncbi:rRNA methylase [Chitinispirillum alkaliphilum]|nr:rRNA methylase [Chitinispirillum alkaliphilum]